MANLMLSGSKCIVLDLAKVDYISSYFYSGLLPYFYVNQSHSIRSLYVVMWQRMSSAYSNSLGIDAHLQYATPKTMEFVHSKTRPCV